MASKIEKFKQPPWIEIWLSHKPSNESDSKYIVQGSVRLEEKIQRLVRQIQLKRNDPILCLSSLKSRAGLGAEYGYKSGQFVQHYALNRDPGNKEHLGLVCAFGLEARRDIATAAGVLPLTTLSITLTSDGYAIIGERNTANVITTGLQPMPSGFTTMDETDTRGTPSTFGNIYNEFFEELLLVQPFPAQWSLEDQARYSQRIAQIAASGSRLDQYGLAQILISQSAPSTYRREDVARYIGDVRLHGLTFADFENRGFANIFSIQSHLSKSAVQEVFDTNKSLWPQACKEVTGYQFVEFTPDAFARFIANHLPQINNHSLAGMLMVGRNLFDNGERWYQETLEQVQKSAFGKHMIVTFPEGYFESGKDVPQTIFETRTYRKDPSKN